MFAEIRGAIDSVKIVSDILEASKDLRNFNEMAAAISKVNTQLMNATAVALESQEKQSALAGRVAELEKQLTEIENWKVERNRYQLHEFSTGVFAYALKEGMEQGEPMHYLCTNCMNKNQKSTLQPLNQNILKCHNCDNTIRINNPPPTQHQVRRR